MKNAGVIALLAIVVVGGLIAYGAGWIPNNAQQANFGQQGTSPNPTDTSSAVQEYRGNLNLSNKVYDSLDSSNTGLGFDTELDMTCWTKTSEDPETKAWIELDIVDESEIGDADIDIDGITEMYCEPHPEDGQEYYIDPVKTLANNHEIDSWMWVDADDDGEDTYAFRVLLTDLNASHDGEATKTINWYVLDEETSDAIIDTASDVSNIATTEVTTVVPFNIDLDTSATGGDAKYIKEMRFRVNTTDDSIIIPSETTISLPNGKSLSLDDFNDNNGDVVGSNIEWKHKFAQSNDYKDGYFIKIDKDTSTEVDFPMNIRSVLGASGTYCIELSFKYINGENTVSSWDDDDVNLHTGTAGTCTIS